MVPFLVLAGCAGTSSDEGVVGESSDGPKGPQELRTSDDLGAVRGVVVDQTLAPIAYATVAVFPAARGSSELANTTTGTDGGFGFSLLDPGAYRLVATHANFGGGAALVQVIAGEIGKTTITLVDLPGSDPYILIQQREGLLKCDWAAVLLSAQCDSFSSATWFPGTVRSINLTIPAGHHAIVGETTWQDASAAMEQYYYHRDGATNKRLAILVGAPILRKELRPGYVEPGTALLPRSPVPETDSSFSLVVQAFYDGRLQREANATFGSACANVKGRCTGAGVVLDFRFSVYVSAFIHGAPPDLSRYSALPDQ